MNETHLAWDRGAINQVITEFFGVGTEQKTTKTYCGKRVQMNSIDNSHFSCPECRKLKAEEDEATKKLFAKLEMR